MARRRIYFEPGTTREQFEAKLAEDLRMMLGFTAFFIGCGLLIWYIEGPTSALSIFVFAGLLALGFLWSQSRRRAAFSMWQYEQQHLAEEQAARDRQRRKDLGLPG